jgi:hypothetical protein
MNDWELFADSMPWFVADYAKVSIDSGRDPTAFAAALAPPFPTLARIIRSATITSVTLDAVKHELLAWDSSDGYRIGWLCLSPPTDAINMVCDSHRLLLKHFGGIIERLNEPDDTRLLNHNSVLTNDDASLDASFIDDYSWAFNGNIPIDAADYYTLAREANGNTTICHRTNCSVLLFAPDHSFDDVTPLDDCPEFTLYNINKASTLTEWIELIAGQWLRHITVAA